jgi:hypothetical protein
MGGSVDSGRKEMDAALDAMDREVARSLWFHDLPLGLNESQVPKHDQWRRFTWDQRGFTPASRLF